MHGKIPVQLVPVSICSKWVAKRPSRLVQRMFLQQPQKAPRAILFAGIDQGTGCSQICLLVAEPLRADVNGSVCLVEANFRSPSLPSLLGTTNHYGLTNAVLHEGPMRTLRGRSTPPISGCCRAAR